MIRQLTMAVTLALALAYASTASAYERWINVHNDDNYGEYIVGVYFAHLDANYWGPNLIGDTIPPGYYQTVYPPGNMQGYCRGDILVTFSNGYEETARNVNFCEETDWTFWSD